MKVQALKAENFKGLKVVDVSIDADIPVVMVSGANGQGKSSLIDAIWAACDNTAVKAAGTDQAIRNGQIAAEVSVDLGELKVTRRWTEKGSTLKVENKEGLKLASPQSVIDKLLSKIAFDPLEFIKFSGQKQREIILNTCGLTQDMEKIRVARKTAYDNRTEINREVKRLETLPRATAGETEEISASEIIAKIKEGNEKNLDNKSKRMNLDTLRNRNKEVTDSISELEKQIEDLKKQKFQLVEQGRALAGEVAALEDIDITALQAALENVTAENKIRAANKAALENETKYQFAKKKSEAFDLQIGSCDLQEKELVSSAKLPVAGLSFTEENVLLNGVPISQISKAEQIKLSCSVAMSLNPELKILRIADGSLLDSKSLKLISEIASEKGFQIWMEVVDESGKVGIFIEDGEVKHA